MLFRSAEAFSDVETVVLQDCLPSPVLQHATHILPSATFVERDGTVVNHRGLAQLIRRAVRGPDGSRPDSRILWELSGRSGLFQAEALRAEIAAAIPGLANLTDPAIRTTGVLLGAPQPAAAQTT